MIIDIFRHKTAKNMLIVVLLVLSHWKRVVSLSCDSPWPYDRCYSVTWDTPSEGESTALALSNGVCYEPFFQFTNYNGYSLYNKTETLEFSFSIDGSIVKSKKYSNVLKESDDTLIQCFSECWWRNPVYINESLSQSIGISQIDSTLVVSLITIENFSRSLENGFWKLFCYDSYVNTNKTVTNAITTTMTLSTTNNDIQALSTTNSIQQSLSTTNNNMQALSTTTNAINEDNNNNSTYSDTRTITSEINDSDSNSNVVLNKRSKNGGLNVIAFSIIVCSLCILCMIAVIIGYFIRKNVKYNSKPQTPEHVMNDIHFVEEDNKRKRKRKEKPNPKWSATSNLHNKNNSSLMRLPSNIILQSSASNESNHSNNDVVIDTVDTVDTAQIARMVGDEGCDYEINNCDNRDENDEKSEMYSTNDQRIVTIAKANITGLPPRPVSENVARGRNFSLTNTNNDALPALPPLPQTPAAVESSNIASLANDYHKNFDGAAAASVANGVILEECEMNNENNENNGKNIPEKIDVNIDTNEAIGGYGELSPKNGTNSWKQNGLLAGNDQFEGMLNIVNIGKDDNNCKKKRKRKGKEKEKGKESGNEDDLAEGDSSSSGDSLFETDCDEDEDAENEAMYEAVDSTPATNSTLSINANAQSIDKNNLLSPSTHRTSKVKTPVTPLSPRTMRLRKQGYSNSVASFSIDTQIVYAKDDNDNDNANNNTNANDIDNSNDNDKNDGQTENDHNRTNSTESTLTTGSE